MRRPTLVDQLNPFEVFAGRELQTGRPLVARLVGRRFDQVMEAGGFDRPYDPRFGKAMVKTLSYLVSTLGCSFGFCERSDMSLYAIANGGDARRLLSRIAGEAAAKLSLLIGQVATFEARLYEFPEPEFALDYFRWRQEDAEVAAIDWYCGHVLAQSGADATAVPRILDGLGPEEKVELLRQNSLDFTAVPAWQRLGAAVWLRPAADGHGTNGAPNGRLLVDLNLPTKDDFGDYVRRALTP
jgi:tRNA(His) 5'-end guanylyltransferase